MNSDNPIQPVGGGERLLRVKDILPLLGGITPAGLHYMIKRGAFPRPIVVSPRNHVWPDSQVRTWIAEREAAARNG